MPDRDAGPPAGDPQRSDGLISPDEYQLLAFARVHTAESDVDELALRAGIGMARVSARLFADYEATVHRPLGLTWPGFRLLFCLWAAGPLQTRELGRLLATTAPTVSSVLNTLERRGLVSRERLPHDQRLVLARLTDTGRETVETAFRRQHQRERQWLDQLSRDQLGALVDALETLLAAHRPATKPEVL